MFTTVNMLANSDRRSTDAVKLMSLQAAKVKTISVVKSLVQHSMMEFPSNLQPFTDRNCVFIQFFAAISRVVLEQLIRLEAYEDDRG